jgi:hypothetical protein
MVCGAAPEIVGGLVAMTGVMPFCRIGLVSPERTIRFLPTGEGMPTWPLIASSRLKKPAQHSVAPGTPNALSTSSARPVALL